MPEGVDRGAPGRVNQGAPGRVSPRVLFERDHLLLKGTCHKAPKGVSLAVPREENQGADQDQGASREVILGLQVRLLRGLIQDQNPGLLQSPSQDLQQKTNYWVMVTAM